MLDEVRELVVVDAESRVLVLPTLFLADPAASKLALERKPRSCLARPGILTQSLDRPNQDTGIQNE